MNLYLKKQIFVAASFACTVISPLIAMNEKNKRLFHNSEVGTDEQMPKKRSKVEMFDTNFYDALDMVVNEPSNEEQYEFIEKYLWNMLPEECDCVYASVLMNDAQKVLDVIDDYECTPLMKCIVKNDFKGVKQLFNQKSAISGHHLYVAMKRGFKDIAEFLLQNIEKTILHKYYLSGENSFIDLALNDSDLDVFFEYLLKAGLTLSNEKIVDFFIQERDEEKLSIALQYVQDINASVYNQTFLAHCIDIQTPELVEICIKNGARSTKRDIINNYIIGCTIKDNTYEFNDRCYKIAELLGGMFPQTSAMDDKKLLNTPLFKQFVKDNELIQYLSREEYNDENWEHIKFLLNHGACPQSRGIYHRDNNLCVISALEMAFSDHYFSEEKLLCFLANGASLDEFVSLVSKLFNSDPSMQKKTLACTWIYLLEAIPSLYGSKSKTEVIAIRHKLVENSFFSKLINQNSLLHEVSPQNAAENFYALFNDGKEMKQLEKDFGFLAYRRYLLRYPKAAKLLLLHSPFRDVSNKDKNKYEQWLIENMQQKNATFESSNYRGFLMMGNTTLFNQIKKPNFIDLYFE